MDTVNAKEFLLDEGCAWAEGSRLFRARLAQLIKKSVQINKEVQEEIQVSISESSNFFDCEKLNPVALNVYIGILARDINMSA